MSSSLTGALLKNSIARFLFYQENNSQFYVQVIIFKNLRFIHVQVAHIKYEPYDMNIFSVILPSDRFCVIAALFFHQSEAQALINALKYLLIYRKKQFI